MFCWLQGGSATQLGVLDQLPLAPHVNEPERVLAVPETWKFARQLNRHVLPACPLQLDPLPPAETAACAIALGPQPGGGGGGPFATQFTCVFGLHFPFWQRTVALAALLARWKPCKQLYVQEPLLPRLTWLHVDPAPPVPPLACGTVNESHAASARQANSAPSAASRTAPLLARRIVLRRSGRPRSVELAREMPATFGEAGCCASPSPLRRGAALSTPRSLAREPCLSLATPPRQANVGIPRPSPQEDDARRRWPARPARFAQQRA